MSGTSIFAHADTTPDPARNKLPQPGDFLVPADTDNETVPIKPGDLKLGDDPVLAWAFDPKAKVPRDASRLNQVLLMRFDPASLSVAERARAADGVVVYSAICTHQGCTVTDWITARQVLQCPCHQSEYDPRKGAQVMGGPAPRPLPALPVKLVADVLVVSAPFTDRIGGEPQRNG
ncbi:MAG: ubiquinol-cytochrome c reductase iron-sulfur subunit [Acetobacteraceae bacterium]